MKVVVFMICTILLLSCKKDSVEIANTKAKEIVCCVNFDKKIPIGIKTKNSFLDDDLLGIEIYKELDGMVQFKAWGFYMWEDIKNYPLKVTLKENVDYHIKATLLRKLSKGYGIAYSKNDGKFGAPFSYMSTSEDNFTELTNPANFETDQISPMQLDEICYLYSDKMSPCHQYYYDEVFKVNKDTTNINIYFKCVSFKFICNSDIDIFDDKNEYCIYCISKDKSGKDVSYIAEHKGGECIYRLPDIKSAYSDRDKPQSLWFNYKKGSKVLGKILEILPNYSYDEVPFQENK